jgi:putative hemolysin
LGEGILSNLVIFLLLVMLHALITLAYAALVNVRQGQLRDQAESGDKGAKRVQELTEGTTRLHTAYQVSLILLRFVIAALVTTTLVEPLLKVNPALAPIIGYGIVLFIAASVTLVLGEIVPESVGSAHANQLAPWLAVPMRWLVLTLNPVVIGLLAVSRMLSALFGTSELINRVTEEEIMTLVDAGHTGGTIEDEEKDMIYSVLRLDQTVVREVMVPRIDVIGIEIEAPLNDALTTFMESGFSRIPVFEDTIDNIKGLLYAKDLLSLVQQDTQEPRKTIRELMRPAYFVPENKRADEMLKELRNQQIHMAMVVDEYGGTAGLVTIENLIEEIVGDIVDEYDWNEEAEYVQQGPNEYTVDASIDLDDFNDLCKVDLPTEDNDTLGGFIYTILGRVPHIGEIINTDDLVLQVESIEGRRIRKVHVTLKADSADQSRPDAVENGTAPTTQEVSDQAK